MRLRFMPFSDRPLRVCPGRIKIAKANMADAISCIVIFQDLFNHEFGFTVRVDKLLCMSFRTGLLSIEHTQFIIYFTNKIIIIFYFIAIGIDEVGDLLKSVKADGQGNCQA